MTNTTQFPQTVTTRNETYLKYISNYILRRVLIFNISEKANSISEISKVTVLLPHKKDHLGLENWH